MSDNHEQNLMIAKLLGWATPPEPQPEPLPDPTSVIAWAIQTQTGAEMVVAALEAAGYALVDKRKLQPNPDDQVWLYAVRQPALFAGWAARMRYLEEHEERDPLRECDAIADAAITNVVTRLVDGWVS